MKDLSRVRHLALDMDGTLYKGGHLFPVTMPFLKLLPGIGVGYTFLTNNTSISKKDYVEKLRRLGIESDEAKIYTPAESTIAYLAKNLPDVHAVGVLGTPSLCKEFEDAGYRVTWEDPEAVVAGFDTTLTYDRLCRAAYWIGNGLPFLATHPDLVCPTDEATILVDCGSICACLAAATGREPLVFGKPNPSILLDLCERLGIAPDELMMVGDRIYTDMRMAREAGAQSALVLTGETSSVGELDPALHPDVVVSHVGELGEALSLARNMQAEKSAAHAGADSGYALKPDGQY